MGDHEQRMEERRQSDHTCIRIELIRAATTLVVGVSVKCGVEDDSVLGRAMAFLATEFASKTPTESVHTLPGLEEQTKVNVEELKEAWIRFKSEPRGPITQEGGWK